MRPLCLTVGKLTLNTISPSCAIFTTKQLKGTVTMNKRSNHARILFRYYLTNIVYYVIMNNHLGPTPKGESKFTFSFNHRSRHQLDSAMGHFNADVVLYQCLDSLYTYTPGGFTMSVCLLSGRHFDLLVVNNYVVNSCGMLRNLCISVIRGDFMRYTSLQTGYTPVSVSQFYKSCSIVENCIFFHKVDKEEVKMPTGRQQIRN